MGMDYSRAADWIVAENTFDPEHLGKCESSCARATAISACATPPMSSTPVNSGICLWQAPSTNSMTTR